MFSGSRPKFYRASLTTALVLFAFLPSTSLAQDGKFIYKFKNFFPEWGLSGQNTLRMDQFDSFGNKSASPYRFSDFQIYNDFSLSANQRLSRAERVETQISGTVNESDYRSTDRGFILERGKVKWQKGDGFLPFRVEMGDFFGQQTFQ